MKLEVIAKQAKLWCKGFRASLNKDVLEVNRENMCQFLYCVKY